jgi:hypothetical protein
MATPFSFKKLFLVVGIRESCCNDSRDALAIFDTAAEADLAIKEVFLPEIQPQKALHYSYQDAWQKWDNLHQENYSAMGLNDDMTPEESFNWFETNREKLKAWDLAHPAPESVQRPNWDTFVVQEVDYCGNLK